ncbi:RsmB/NOP family class I SAM-dependent RNA methyltransferase [Pseudonocardia halophobica]|uniref:RsmB/NOP family class I SAM-dependent RNA methyltransferase n=1 Tax=Pseudonocardia halophobica TaxID=29401 RepID=UPI0009DD9621|nr:transcription antitermination factor NusB [Pseudonocardia halophobica]
MSEQDDERRRDDRPRGHRGDDRRGPSGGDRRGGDRRGGDRRGGDRSGGDRSGGDRRGSGDGPRGGSRGGDRDRGQWGDRDRGGRGERGGDRGGDRRQGGPRRDRGAGPRNSGPPRRRANPPGPPAGDPARQAAFELLTAVRERDAYANLVLPSILRRYRLKDRDAALATELGYGTLRAAGQLDAVIEACADRPLHRIEGPLVDAMRLGTYQLLRMRVPEHAAVATSVDIVRGLAGSRSSGFVNAILRKVAETAAAKGAEEWLAELAPDEKEDPIGHASFVHAHPKWIGQAFADALGSHEELPAALAADDARPAVHLLARPGEITAEELALVTGGTEAPYSPYGVHLEPGSGEVGELDAIREGVATVQDEGSQLVALAVSRAELVGEDTGRWLDLCAGPGGKAVLLGALVGLDGGTLDAVEQTEHRADLVRKSTDGLPVTVHHADGREAPLPDGAFDRVLVDAPCTGLGALRRRPEARWRRKPEDVSALAKLQRELLLAALRHVRVGGVVGYVTCSPHLSETVGVVGGIVRRKDLGVTVERLDARGYLPGVPELGPGPHVQLWPHRHGTDAMFLTLLRRTA